jgi:hypothetical protein
VAAYTAEQAQAELDRRASVENKPTFTAQQARAELQRRAAAEAPREELQEYQDVPSVMSGILPSAAKGVTYGHSDEIRGAIGGLTTAVTGQIRDAIEPGDQKTKFWDEYNSAYTDIRDDARTKQARYEKAHPGAALAAEIAGGFVVPGGFAKTGWKAASKIPGLSGNALKQNIGKAAVVGATGGAVAGSGLSDKETAGGVARDAAEGAVLGATIAGAIPALQPAVKRVLAPASDWINKITRGMRGKDPEMEVFTTNRDGMIQLSDQALDEIENAARRGEIDPADLATGNEAIKQRLIDAEIMTPEQAANFNLFKKHGVEPTSANISQSTDDWRNQMDAAKVSGRVGDAVSDQEEAITSSVEKQIGRIQNKGTATNATGTSSRVYSVIDEAVSEMDTVIDDAYNAARAASKGHSPVNLNRFAEGVRTMSGSDKASMGVISHARGLLNNMGKDGLSVDDAEVMRQGLNSLYDSTSPVGRRMIRELKEMIDEDVASVVGKDLFEQARAAKIKYHKRVGLGRRNKHDKGRTSLLEKIIDNEIPEEDIYKKIKAASTRHADIVNVKEFLLEGGEAGQAAWDDIRGQFIRDAFEKATEHMGKVSGGGKRWNHVGFGKVIADIRMNTKKWDTLFTKAEQKFIREIEKIGDLRQPVSNVAQGSGPSGLAIIGKKVTHALNSHPVLRYGLEAIEAAGETVGVRTQAREVLDPAAATARHLRNK